MACGVLFDPAAFDSTKFFQNFNLHLYFFLNWSYIHIFFQKIFKKGRVDLYKTASNCFDFIKQACVLQ